MIDVWYTNEKIKQKVNDLCRGWRILHHIFLLVFSLTNKESFEHGHGELFYEELSKTKQIDNQPNNRSDLAFNNHDKGQYATDNASLWGRQDSEQVNKNLHKI